MSTENILAHYGVPGMKWGKRKASSIKAPDHTEARQLKSKKVSELSNAELKKINERRQLEKKYKDLNPDAVTVGRKQVTAVLALGATAATAIALAKGPVGQLGREAIAKAVKASMSNTGRHVAVAAVKTAKHL